MAVTVITHYARDVGENCPPLSLIIYCNDGGHGIKTPFFIRLFATTILQFFELTQFNKRH